MSPKVLPDSGDNILAKVRSIRHRHKHAADLQLGIDLPLDTLYRPHQFCHILGGQIISLNRDQDIIRGRQSVNDQHTQGGAAIQQNIVVVGFHTVYILLQDGFTAHDIDQAHLHSR